MEKMKKINIENFSNLRNAKEVSFCRYKLDVFDKRNYCKICLLSDIHLGAKCSDLELLGKLIDKCLNEKIYVILMGDLIEASTKNSVGSGVYDQNLNPNEQIFLLMNLLEPLFKERLILSILRGNHEERFKKDVGIDISSIIACTNKVSYLGTGGFHHLNVGNISYNLYCVHGNNSSNLLTSKIKKVIDYSKTIEGFDIFAYAHVHELMWWENIIQKVNEKKRKLEYQKRYFIITGHYLNYEQSYMKGSGSSQTIKGSPIITLYSDEKRIEIEKFSE